MDHGGLKDVYPLYLNNKAKQPNADLEVTDKYHRQGRVPRRPGGREDDRRRHRRARSTRPSRWRGCRATRARRCSSIASTASGSGSTSSLMRSASRRASRSRISEGRGHPADRHLPDRRRGERADDRRGPAARHLPARQGLSGHLEAGADRPVQLHLAVQLPAQPRRPQGRAGDRGRLPVRDEAGLRARRLGAIIMGEVLAETDLPKGAFSILPAHREGADLFTTDERLKLLSFTGSPAVGWELKATRRQEEGGARARRQRGGDRRQGRRPRRRARAGDLRRLLPVGPVLHRRAAHPHPRRGLRRIPRRCWSRRRRAWSPAIPRTATSSSAR